ncbi:MAG: LacI family DNA-binding transcriptional regulator [Caldilineaceae bacterium]
MTTTRRVQPAKRVTMRDVAKLAQVSQSTVSRVLSHTPQVIPIGDETRQRVLNAVTELGYYPNLHAGSLRGQKTRMIALLIADISNPFYHPMVRAAQDVAHAHRYDVMVTNSDHVRENELLFCESLIRRPVDGIILVPYHLTNEHIDQLIMQTGASITVLGQHITHKAVDVVCVDDGKGTYDAISWLIRERGHRRIGFIGVTQRFPPGARRYAAYIRAMQDAGLSLPTDDYLEGDWSVESGQWAMRAFLQSPTPPTAIFACNDLMAIGAILAAQELGYRVPEDVAVVGFDNIPAASWLRPRLTTVEQSAAAIGQTLAQALFERVEGKVTGQRRHEIPCALIQRESA